jgi:hypothetical protein
MLTSACLSRRTKADACALLHEQDRVEIRAERMNDTGRQMNGGQCALSAV